MKKYILIYVMAFLHTVSYGQTITFESLSFGSKNYWKGDSGVAGTTTFQGIQTGANATFTNRNDTSSWGDYWSGYAYSKLKDSVSISYADNDCAAFPAIGHNGSDVYVVAYYNVDVPEYNTIRLQGEWLSSMYVANTTIAYRSMQNGDGLAKKFGGASGNDPDYFRIIFKAWKAGTLLPDTIQCYLADFRDSNNSNDYILKDWKKVDLFPKFFDADSLSYTLESSDTNSFGMLTPSYFCIDDLQFAPFASVQDQNTLSGVRLFPNPCTDFVMIENKLDQAIRIRITTLNGSVVAQSSLPSFSTTTMNCMQLPSGIYLVSMDDGQRVQQLKLCK